MDVASELQNQSEIDIQLFSLAEQFLAQLRADPQLRLDVFARQHPALESEILAGFPGLLLTEKLRQQQHAGAESAPAASIPQTIGSYQLLRRIGSGGMGTVYEASHARLSRRTAIKVLNAEAASCDALKKRLQSEADLTSRLHHPHIVPVLDFAEHNGTAFLSMLYIDGVSMDRILHEHWGLSDNSECARPPECLLRPGHDFRQIARTGAQAASALAHAHEQGTIHRDIKPGNLILDRSGKTWVTDFGLATHFENESYGRQSEVVGTPRYVSPEQLIGKADQRSDVYSLGVTLYELASGERAFGDVPPDQLRRKSSRSLRPIQSVNSRVPGPLAEIIDVACSVNPGDRYPTARELQTVLSRFAHSGVSGDRRQRVRTGKQGLGIRAVVAMTLFACLAAIVVALISGNAWVETGGKIRWFMNPSPLVLPRTPLEPQKKPVRANSHDGNVSSASHESDKWSGFQRIVDISE